MLTKVWLRSLSRRKLESIAVILLVTTSIAGFLTIRMAANYAVTLAGKVWVYEAGNIIVVLDGLIAEHSIMNIFDGLPIEKYKLMEGVWTLGYYNKTPLSLVIIYNPSPSYPFSYTPRLNMSGNKVLLYYPGSKLSIPKGSTLFIDATGSEKVVVTGAVHGVVTVGSSDVVLLADRELVKKLATGVNSVRTILSIILRPGVDVEDVRNILIQRLRNTGYSVTLVHTVTETENPARKPIESVAKTLETLALTGQAIALLLIGFTSLLAVERNIREVGVLEALGASRLQIALFYSSHNIARGLAGALLGLLVSIPLSKVLVEWGVRQAAGGSSTASLLLQFYRFKPQLQGVVGSYVLILAAVAVAAILPPLLYVHGETTEKLRYAGQLRTRFHLSVIAEPEIALAFRSLIIRPWKLVALVFLAGFIWGSLASIGMLSKGYEGIVREIKGSDFQAVVHVPSIYLEKSIALLIGSPNVQAVDAYLVYWHSAIINGRGVTVVARLSGGEYLWYPLAQGRLPTAPGEVVLSARLASELNAGIGDMITVKTSTGRILALRVVGVAHLLTNNGLAVLVSYSTAKGAFNDKAADAMLLVLSTSLSQDQLVLTVKRLLADKGIPADVSGKDRILRNLKSAEVMLKAFMLIVESAVIIAGLLGLLLIGIADLAAHIKEIGVLRAIGYTDTRIAILQVVEVATAWLLSSPLALALGYIMAHHMALLLKEAVGVIQPAEPLTSMLEASWIAPLACMLALVIWKAYIQRMETTQLLTIE